MFNSSQKIDHHTSIFVIDDEPVNFDVINIVLSEEGYAVFYAPNAEKALEMMDRVDPDLLLLDVMMPEIDGITLCQLIKADDRWKHIPIIMVTALTSKHDLARCLEAGADDFISKPVNFQELRARVRSMLRIQKQFRQIQSLLQTRDAMFHAIVHDLRNPLNSLVFAADTLQETNGVLSPKSQERFSRSVETMSRLVNDILLLGKLESTQLRTTLQSINLVDLAQQALDDATIFASQKNITLKSTYTLNPPEVNLDPYLLRRTLDNLLMNAIKFSPMESEVHCHIYRPDSNHIQVDLIDQGFGIPDEQKLAIFEPYESTDMSKGVAQIGLGLTFCKTVAEAHGGSITVTNNQPQGSIFSLTLPKLE